MCKGPGSLLPQVGYVSSVELFLSVIYIKVYCQILQNIGLLSVRVIQQANPEQLICSLSLSERELPKGQQGATL